MHRPGRPPAWDGSGAVPPRAPPRAAAADPVAARAFASSLALVATNLDGTIMREDGTVSPRTLAALRACAQAAVHLVFVTGRPVRWTAPLASEAGSTQPVICATGAVVLDLGRGEVLRPRPVAPATVLAVAERHRRRCSFRSSYVKKLMVWRCSRAGGAVAGGARFGG